MLSPAAKLLDILRVVAAASVFQKHTEGIEGGLHVVGLQHGDGEVERIGADASHLRLASAEIGDSLSTRVLADDEIGGNGRGSSGEASREEDSGSGGGLHFDFG